MLISKHAYARNFYNFRKFFTNIMEFLRAQSFLLRRKVVLLFRRLKSHKILAVYEDDLDDLLVQLGLDEKIKDGKFNCLKCGCTISRENLGVIENSNGAIQISCLSSSCMSKSNIPT